MKTEKLIFEELTEKIIKCFYAVFDELGSGFLESVYEKALFLEFKEMALKAENQKSLNVIYKKQVVGNFKPDIIVENKVIIEVKAVFKVIAKHDAQLINYLRSTGIKVGLLVNFGENLEFKRKVF